MLPAVSSRKLAAISDLVPAIFPVLFVARDVFEGYLFIAPGMAQNSILIRRVGELHECLSRSIDESHGGRLS